ncbi:MAG: hypothetical protein ACREJN_21255 [Nitrospiraceae bacterium]
MARTLEQVLKARGYSDTELAAMSTVLQDPRFRKNLEEEIAAADTAREQNTKLTKDLDEYDRWFTNEITPEHTKLLKEREDAVAEAAASKARLELIQKRGMQRQGEIQDPALASDAEKAAQEAAERARAAGQPTTKYVDEQTFQGAFERTGEAIASGVDLMFDHQELFGTRLNMQQIFLDAKAAKMPVRKYWESHFKVAEKRAEIAEKARGDNEARIRDDQRQKDALEFGGGSNPNLRVPIQSRNPFVSRRAEGEKQPWEINENERNLSRVQKAFQKAVARGEA